MKGLFLGLTTIDIQYLVNSFPKENGKQKSENFLLAIGGPALNAAATFAELGGEAKFFTIIGTHVLSGYISEQCQKFNIECVDLNPSHSEFPIIASVLSNAQTGARSIIRNKGSEPLPSLDLLEKELSPDYDIILIDGFHMPAAISLSKFGKAHKIPVVFDGGSWKAGCEDLLPRVDIAICSHDFSAPGLPVMDYLSKVGINYRAITHGEHPVRYEFGQEAGSISVPQVKAVDSLGAGDVFHGAFCYYSASGNDFITSLKLASMVASESTTRFGVRASGEAN